MHRLDLGLCSHPKEVGGGGGGGQNSCKLQGKNPLYRKKSPQRRIEPTTLYQAGQRAQHSTNGPLTSCKIVCWLFALTPQQHASVSQGRICSDNFTCCHTETTDQSFHLTQSQYTDTGPTIPSTVPVTPGAWQGNLWSANF